MKDLETDGSDELAVHGSRRCTLCWTSTRAGWAAPESGDECSKTQ